MNESIRIDRERAARVEANQAHDAEYIAAQRAETAALEQLRADRAASLPIEPDDGFIVKVRTAEGTYERRFTEDMDIKVLFGWQLIFMYKMFNVRLGSIHD